MRFPRAIFLVVLMLQVTGLYAGERHAFVIGNSEYPGGSLGSLSNPRKDASDMAAVLRQLGYIIYSGGALLDLDNKTFGKELRIFRDQLPRDATALFYFAGHGVGYNGDNYLIPVRSDINFQGQLADRAISLRSVVALLKNRPGDTFNIFLLDACRDNPLKTRGTSGGLESLSNIPRGTFIGYAAEPKKGAIDANGEGNGVYTGELLQALATSPGEPIESVHKRVAENVYTLTGGAQLPTYESLLLGEYCFAICRAIATNPPPSLLPKADNPEQNSPILTTKAEERSSQIKPWMMVLGAVLVGALISNTGGSGGQADDFTIVLDPPTP